MNERSHLDGVIRRWSRSDARPTLLLRGSVLLAAWVGRHRRPVRDVDFAAVYPFDPGRTLADLRAALAAPCQDDVRFDLDGARHEVIYGETAFPGVRLCVPVASATGRSMVQIDVAYEEPLVGGPVETPIALEDGVVRLWSPRPEVCYGWKLHGLVERDTLAWRAKDLADLWLLQSCLVLDEPLIQSAIQVAFESRQAPIWYLDRLVSRQFGLSSTSRRHWSRLLREMPGCGVPTDLSVAVEQIASRVRPHWQALRGTVAAGVGCGDAAASLHRPMYGIDGSVPAT